MSSKGWFVFLLLALAMVAEAYTTLEEHSPTVSDDDMDLIVEDNEFLMSSESQRRILMMQGQRNRYISYAALRANNIPCGWHGRSYYDCSKRDRANPYRRGCSAITHCARDTSS